jgi:hypothetical protein
MTRSRKLDMPDRIPANAELTESEIFAASDEICGWGEAS